MSDHEPELTLADAGVVSKYTMASDIVNRTLTTLLSKCVAEASVKQLCLDGDTMLTEETAKCYKKDKEIKKGIAFPVCISINNCINHFSPANEDVIIADGDLVKFDLGAHIDGFVAVVGHTVVVGASETNKVTGRQADVMLAAHYASLAAFHLVKPGNENYAVTDAVKKVADVYKCKPVEGMLSFQLQQGRIDGEKTIIQNPTEQQRKEVEKAEFEVNEVYGVDVIVSTGAGQGKEMDTRITIYRKTDEVYSLKLKTSREFFSKVNKNCGVMPFNIRVFEDEKRARMGVVECITHKLIDPYPVLWEKPSEYVAQFKFTVLLLPNSRKKITGLQFDNNFYESEYSIEDPELVSLTMPVSGKAKKKQKPKEPSDKEAPAEVVQKED